MVDQPAKTLQDLVKHVERYPEEAYLFVREGLSYAAERVHGPETEAHRHLHQYLLQHNLDWHDLVARYHANELPDPVVAAIDAAGGCDKLNRHVSGRELSHGHGYPLRLVAPGKRGFEWVKWVASIEVNESPKWLQPPLPLQ